MKLPGIVKIFGKRCIGALKGVRMEGTAFVSPLANIHGGGRIHVGTGARIASGCEVWVRGAGAFELGAGSTLNHGVRVRPEEGFVRIGSGSHLVFNSLVYGQGGVDIGDRVLIGNSTLINSTDHTYPGRSSVALQPMRRGRVVIDDDVWIGAFCVVLPDVHIGEGAIIGSHSLVKEDVPPYTVVGGVPARVLRTRTEDD